MSTLLLGGVSPLAEEEFLYACQFQGEARCVLEATGTAAAGKTAENVLSEFQRGGFFLTHLLECPLETSGNNQTSLEKLLVLRVPAIATRIRRSLKPKRVVLISSLLAPLMQRLSATELGCPVILDGTKPFQMDGEGSADSSRRLRDALTSTAAAGN